MEGGSSRLRVGNRKREEEEEKMRRSITVAREGDESTGWMEEEEEEKSRGRLRCSSTRICKVNLSSSREGGSYGS